VIDFPEGIPDFTVLVADGGGGCQSCTLYSHHYQGFTL
jgi:hypothetical protein